MTNNIFKSILDNLETRLYFFKNCNEEGIGNKEENDRVIKETEKDINEVYELLNK